MKKVPIGLKFNCATGKTFHRDEDRGERGLSSTVLSWAYKPSSAGLDPSLDEGEVKRRNSHFKLASSSIHTLRENAKLDEMLYFLFSYLNRVLLLFCWFCFVVFITQK